jgi:hypothetical protein
MLVLALFLGLRIVPDTANVQFRQPQIAARQDLVAVTFGAGDTVYYAGSRDGGMFFSKPVVVSSKGKLALGRHRGPRIALLPSSIVISAIVGEKGGGADGDLFAWRSADGGRSWSEPVRVNDVPGAAREGLHAMAAQGDTLFAAWLDLRAQGTRLYGASSGDGGRTWSPNVLIYASPAGHICECCHPSVAISASGAVYAMWRNWLGGSRDMYLAQSGDGGKTFHEAEKLGAGTWPLKACPMDGGGLVVTPEGKVVTVWRREGEVFLAPAGGAESSVGEGWDPALTYGRDGVYAIWKTPAGLFARLPGKSGPTRVSFEGSFPQLAALPGGLVLAAWEEKGAIVVRAIQ